MSNNLDNFRCWYSRILDILYEDEHAGFVILMIAFPLLERYLREKSGDHEGNLTDEFYNELRHIYPALTDRSIASTFWQVYRNGILHQVTLSQANRKGIHMPEGWLSSGVEMITIGSFGEFWVHPMKFSRRVVETIESDFATFEGQSSDNHPLPVVRVQTACGTSGTSGRSGTSGPGHEE
jgi:hypothetical protein